jgi:hypothetical protein
MNSKELLALQTQRGAKIAAGGDTTTKSFEAVTRDCRKYIEEHSDTYRDYKAEDKKTAIQGLIKVIQTEIIILMYLS